MKITVTTTTIGTVERDVADCKEAVQVLKQLTLDGNKCIRWVVEDT